LNKTKFLALAVACTGAMSTPALADQESTAQWQQMKAEIDALKKQVGSLSSALSKAQRAGFGRQAPAPSVARSAQRSAAPGTGIVANAPAQGTGSVADAAAQSRAYAYSEQQAQQPPPQAPSAVRAADVPTSQLPASAQTISPTTLETTTLPSAANAAPRSFLEHKPGKTLTFVLPGGEITGYGNFDVSLDAATKGYPTGARLNGTYPVGRRGWLPDISSNLSFVGVRGFENIPGQPFRFVYQLETQLDISAASGSSESNSAQSNVVKSGLTSRNSYIGLSNARYGSILFGKTDAPYKVSTARMNPFLGEWGDYSVIMGNTGGDNRVEFATRLDHSIWYESPQIAGLKFNALYSPGQNRASNSDNIASGESDCTGGNIPGSGGSVPYACNDGGFSDAISTSLSYVRGPLYAVVAYERHGKVNRRSDLTGQYANVPPAYYSGDVADEDAAKIGIQYSFPTNTTVSGIYERLHRYVPAFLNFQNERSHDAYWLAATQLITPRDNVSIGWAHADRTPGDPGQHNTSINLPPLGSPGDSTGGTNVDNSANMFTIAYKHELGAGLVVYVDFAAVLNAPFAHYALGAGGRSVTTDGHDASNATGGESSNPHIFAGSTIMGTSLGLKYTF